MQNAREYIGFDCEGDKQCCSCGLIRATKQISKSIKTTFTDFTALITNPSQYICDSCLSLYNDKNMRFKPIYSDIKGTYKIIDRSDVIEIIRNPKDEFILSLPYSFKKHHWLYAGKSNKQVAEIGTDERKVIIDYRKTNINKLVDNIKDLIQYGVPRSEIISGKYSVFTLSKFPFIKKVESELLADVRQSGLVELIVKYTPSTKNKKKYESEELTLLSKAEKNAVYILSVIAIGSEYRVQNGLQFWGNFFERRINRFKHLDAHEFVSKLAEAVGTSHVCGYHETIEEMSEEQLNEAMDAIRNKTHLLVSIVYSERKKD